MIGDWAAENFVGGHPALDFVNTAGGGTKARDTERLLSYSDLLAWSDAADLTDRGEVESLAQQASARPVAAQDLLRAALEFRESLHAVLIAKQADVAIPEGDLRGVEDAIRARLSDACLVNSDGRLRWTAEPRREPLSLPYVRIALAAHDLLMSDAVERVRNCERCSWLFLDKGRGKPRRWCSMAACGNRAKAARHYAREKQRAEKRA
jgi:predicted RNA-binding Zn ribbon-like protein